MIGVAPIRPQTGHEIPQIYLRGCRRGHSASTTSQLIGRKSNERSDIW